MMNIYTKWHLKCNMLSHTECANLIRAEAENILYENAFPDLGMLISFLELYRQPDLALLLAAADFSDTTTTDQPVTSYALIGATFSLFFGYDLVLGAFLGLGLETMITVGLFYFADSIAEFLQKTNPHYSSYKTFKPKNKYVGYPSPYSIYKALLKEDYIFAKMLLDTGHPVTQVAFKYILDHAQKIPMLQDIAQDAILQRQLVLGKNNSKFVEIALSHKNCDMLTMLFQTYSTDVISPTKEQKEHLLTTCNIDVIAIEKSTIEHDNKHIS